MMIQIYLIDYQENNLKYNSSQNTHPTLHIKIDNNLLRDFIYLFNELCWYGKVLREDKEE